MRVRFDGNHFKLMSEWYSGQGDPVYAVMSRAPRDMYNRFVDATLEISESEADALLSLVDDVQYRKSDQRDRLLAEEIKERVEGATYVNGLGCACGLGAAIYVPGRSLPTRRSQQGRQRHSDQPISRVVPGRCNCENSACKEHRPGGCTRGAGMAIAAYVGPLCNSCAYRTPLNYLRLLPSGERNPAYRG